MINHNPIINKRNFEEFVFQPIFVTLVTIIIVNLNIHSFNIYNLLEKHLSLITLVLQNFTIFHKNRFSISNVHYSF